jgi:hypothetical protein
MGSRTVSETLKAPLPPIPRNRRPKATVDSRRGSGRERSRPLFLVTRRGGEAAQEGVDKLTSERRAEPQWLQEAFAQDAGMNGSGHEASNIASGQK